MLRAVGFGDDDFKKPQIGIASTWSMVTPCNMHINELADHAEAGANAAGAKASSSIPSPSAMVSVWEHPACVTHLSAAK